VDDVLKKIYEARARRLEVEMRDEPYAALHERALATAGDRRPFLAALRASTGTAVIAEIKRASPSAGLIAHNFDHVAIGRLYENAGADAISVLTERDHFLGDLHFLQDVRDATKLPLLRKDFLSGPYEVAQSAAYGADCILLIVAGLDDASVGACLDEARLFGLDVLVEVHGEDELERALGLGATLIGVNNRNLRTMTTNLAVSECILPLVPPEIFAISESGMSGPRDVERLTRAGARGVLVGESLMRSEDPVRQIVAMKACTRA